MKGSRGSLFFVRLERKIITSNDLLNIVISALNLSGVLNPADGNLEPAIRRSIGGCQIPGLNPYIRY